MFDEFENPDIPLTQDEILNQKLLDIDLPDRITPSDYDLTQKSESTYFAHGLYPISPNVNPDEMLSAGTYEFYISNPDGSVNIDELLEGSLQTPTEDEDAKKVNFEIIKTHYAPANDMAVITVKILDDPPVFLIYGAVAVVLFVVGALSINSILESVVKVAESVGNLLKSPATYGIILIFLLPLVLPLLSKGKRIIKT